MSILYSPQNLEEHIHQHMEHWYDIEDPFKLFEYLVFNIVLVVVEIVLAQQLMIRLGIAHS